MRGIKEVSEIINLTTQTSLGLSGEILQLPKSETLGNYNISLYVTATSTLRPTTGEKVNGSTGDYSLVSGTHLLFTTGTQNSGWHLLTTTSGTVTSVTGTTGQISSSGTATPQLSFAWSATGNQIVGLNNAGAAYEGKTIFAGSSNMTVTHAANSINVDLGTGIAGTKLTNNTVTTSQLALNTIQIAHVTLTSANIQGMYSAPSTTVVGVTSKTIVPMGAYLVSTYGSSAFGGGGDITVTVGATTATATLSANFLKQTSNQVAWIEAAAFYGASTGLIGSPVKITNASGAFTIGDGALDVYTLYRVLP